VVCPLAPPLPFERLSINKLTGNAGIDLNVLSPVGALLAAPSFRAGRALPLQDKRGLPPVPFSVEPAGRNNGTWTDEIHVSMSRRLASFRISLKC
jgi:hypothetical protein